MRTKFKGKALSPGDDIPSETDLVIDSLELLMGLDYILSGRGLLSQDIHYEDVFNDNLNKEEIKTDPDIYRDIEKVRLNRLLEDLGKRRHYDPADPRIKRARGYLNWLNNAGNSIVRASDSLEKATKQLEPQILKRNPALSKKLTPTQVSALYDELIRRTCIPEDSDPLSFKYLFWVGEKPDHVKPFKWNGQKYELALFVEQLCESFGIYKGVFTNEKGREKGKLVWVPFEKMFAVKGLRGALNDIKDVPSEASKDAIKLFISLVKAVKESK